MDARSLFAVSTSIALNVRLSFVKVGWSLAVGEINAKIVTVFEIDRETLCGFVRSISNDSVLLLRIVRPVFLSQKNIIEKSLIHD